MKKNTSSGHIYWFQIQEFFGQKVEDGPIKFGLTTREVEERLREWQTTLAFCGLRFIGKEFAENPEERERFLKTVFKEYMITRLTDNIDKSEWFRPGERIIAYVKQLKPDYKSGFRNAIGETQLN